jgi:uncharacterized GH25 family protein
MCGAPEQGTDPAGTELTGVDVTKETVIQGQVLRDGAPVPAAYVRLLDSTGEFTAEVVTSATGDFRFFAAPGEWTLRALTAGSTGERRVAAARGLNTLQVELAGA